MGTKIRCLKCGGELESKFRHDFKKCSCDNETFVDGGNDYFRYGCINIDLIEYYDSVLNIWRKFKYQKKEIISEKKKDEPQLDLETKVKNLIEKYENFRKISDLNSEKIEEKILETLEYVCGDLKNLLN